MENQASQTVCLEIATVRALMQDIFSRLNVPPEENAIVVQTILEASLAGYDSHGIMRIPMYVRGIRRGAMIPGAKMAIIQETAASVYLDAGYGLGPVAATEAVRLASTKAEQTGVGCVSVVNANDVARLGGYLVKPAQAGLIALMVVNDAGGGPCVAPWGGVEAFLSTNPIAAGIPWREEAPIIIDISTSVVSGSKLKMLANRGEDARDGWLIDKENNFALDLSSFFSAPKQSALLPLGGLIAGHKGFALSLLVEVLAGALSGAGCSKGIENGMDRNGVFVLVIAPEKFVSRAQVKQSVEGLVVQLKNAKRAPQIDEILIPGECAYRERQKRLNEGIPIDAPIWREIRQILKEVGAPLRG
ncbi:Ldh family oxidoreductase [Chloroflexi bacterium TSY]|nr:Ldh family oxidoreductase [Chloroflexi bacterium TSY]